MIIISLTSSEFARLKGSYIGPQNKPRSCHHTLLFLTYFVPYEEPNSTVPFLHFPHNGTPSLTFNTVPRFQIQE